MLHGFALSLLVDERRYAAVARYVNQTDLGQRLVYQRVAQGQGRSTPRAHLPSQPGHSGWLGIPIRHYCVILIERDMAEILDSQARMLNRLGADQARHDARADPARAYLQQLEAARAWLARHGIPAIAVDDNALVGEPAAQAEAVARFLGRDAAAPDMAGAVDPALYRSRRG